MAKKQIPSRRYEMTSEKGAGTSGRNSERSGDENFRQ